ncbi:Diacylglycerol kinase A [Choanephora cucurbitarum]|uniref:diacylglycerol kinase (ATP) n=1 Tax=Choanephora cucurbitarum TaxID=101091 RepID=A0A1C7N854_9FUNG|nr:Diacylglycerol kinase A [Choanephora cucurbitarum]
MLDTSVTPILSEDSIHHSTKPVAAQDFARQPVQTDKPSSTFSSSDDDESPSTPTVTPDIETTKRPSMHLDNQVIRNSVKLDDTTSEGRPSIYLFVFVNPLSGDRKGEDLVTLPIQHFRLRRFPQVQLEVHNILDEEDRSNAIKNIQLIEAKLKLGQIPDIEAGSKEDEGEQKATLSPAVQTRHIHVWSAGGDGTVMSVFELLVSHKIDLDQVFFSCIPFGTGNDFSQVLGWGRTIPTKNILGSKLQNLEELISDRLEKSEAARLDIWQIKMTSYPSGYVCEAGPKERRDGHDVAEVKGSGEKKPENVMVRKMSNYISLGVQGYVGSGFEAHRSGNRLGNMFVYAHESSKWVFWRHFPNLNRFIKNFTQNGQPVLQCSLPEERKSDVSNQMAEITRNPIDMVIQNIPHIWGREVDLWGEARSGLDAVTNRSGPTDPASWKPQRANDGRLEVMTIENMTSYLKKLANIRHHVSRIGQFDSPFEINFREPEDHMKETDKLADNTSAWTKTKAFVKDKKRHKFEKKNMLCVMCDGEFYEIKDPKSIAFECFAQIWTLGRNDEHQGRLVKDELDAQQDNTETVSP